jgi:two-component system sensor histidine kinase UhpB
MTRLEAFARSPPIDLGVVLFTGAFTAQIASAWSSRSGSGEEIVWLPGGLLLSALVAVPQQRWPATVFATAAGAGLAAALVGPSIIDAMLDVATLLILVPVAAYVFGRVCADTQVLRAFRNLAWFFAVFLVALPLLSAAMVVPIHYASGLRDNTLLHAANEALAQSLGYLVFLPLWIHPAISGFWRRRVGLPKLSSIAMALVATAVIGLLWNRLGSIGYLRPLLVLAPVPFLTLIALRAGFVGTHAFVVLVAAVAFALSLNVRGPFVEPDTLLTLLSVKSWVLATSAATWMLAFVVEQRFTMRRALVDSGREVRELAGRLIQAQEQERSRIARDLHDDVNQRLASASIQVSALRRAADENARLALDHLQNDLIALSEDVRHISHNLHPSMLHETGLKAALSTLCSSQRHRNGPAIDLHVETSEDDVPDVVALCLYRATQEALGNAIRHADAMHIEVHLRIDAGKAELTVGDDGRGFITGGDKATPRGLGLLSLEERAKLLGGHFRLDAAPGKGVRVCLSIPLRHAR